MATKFLVLSLAALPSAHAWGVLGHATVAYIAQNYLNSATASWAQGVLGDTSTSYLANVASWADTYRATTAGAWSAPFHVSNLCLGWIVCRISKQSLTNSSSSMLKITHPQLAMSTTPETAELQAAQSPP